MAKRITRKVHFSFASPLILSNSINIFTLDYERKLLDKNIYVYVSFLCCLRCFFSSSFSSKVLFTQYEYSELSSLPPDVLRNALSLHFSNEQRFRLGQMDDAAEAFENIIKRIHFHLTNKSNDDAQWCTADCCITHNRFSMNISEEVN